MIRILKTKKRPCWIENHICHILLQNGLIAICDADRIEEVNKINWYQQKTDGYISGWVRTSTEEKGRLVALHNFLYPELGTIDHINHNKSDNTSKNLRTADATQNMMNRKMSKNNKSGYKGVCTDKYGYQAKICINRKKIYLGMFKNPIDAAKVYNKAAIELFGEFAHINILPEGE